ncbi:non-canonical purine NTP pyrophosphatase [Bifidobacterium aemilianum]|uniref:dITP/XTP pyrophosphatase n=1 Tax=Bifidobacterium aemilianum TaxID=2493120 RepID=A0A366K7Y8_9BIFI|nr:non-canonical purine NTP pyrophosphatase [Bifidobacterium aemilianum]RBP97427.1 non-canonical purine NTP pyrophosphatase [Bifidobacterium aemilianum]
MKIVVATHNEGKLVEMRNILQDELGDTAADIELVSAGSLGLPDPVETGVSFEENALIKAQDVALRTGLPAVADDSGLVVDVLGAAPGILSARWAGAHGHDRANMALLLAQIEDIPDGRRQAHFSCAAALVVPKAEEGSADGGTVYAVASQTVEEGRMTGFIIREMRGDQGFGYDPIFVPDDQPARAKDADESLTSAELTPAEKNAISHRGKAVKALAPAIKNLIVGA